MYHFVTGTACDTSCKTPARGNNVKEGIYLQFGNSSEECLSGSILSSGEDLREDFQVGNH